jgi:galactokinase
MTGGGFGGSVIVLVEDAPLVAGAVEDAFQSRGWVEPRWFLAVPDDGAGPVN